MKTYAPLSEKEERIAKAVVAAAFAVHQALGPGLLESVYGICFCHELTKRGLSYARQVIVPIVYDGINFDGFLINFNVPIIKHGIKRVIL